MTRPNTRPCTCPAPTASSPSDHRAEPYAEFIESYPGDEYTRVLEGSITLTGDDGVAHTFGPGDSFTLSRGWRGHYRVTERLVKQFAIYVS